MLPTRATTQRWTCAVRASVRAVKRPGRVGASSLPAATRAGRALHTELRASCCRRRHTVLGSCNGRRFSSSASAACALHKQETAVVDDVAGVVARARRVLFITGAGLSAESGLATYRGPGGLYDGDRPTDDGVAVEHALSIDMLHTRPALTWKYLREIEAGCRGAKPNAAHEAIAQLQQHAVLGPGVWVLTQNVDGLHCAAHGDRVIEMHGDLHDVLCTRCEYRVRVDTYEELAAGLTNDGCPACPACGAMLRPRVVLFGESLPARELGTLQSNSALGWDAVFSVGTSSMFGYVVEPALNTYSVEVNPEPTPLTPYATVSLRARAGQVLPRLVELVEARLADQGATRA